MSTAQKALPSKTDNRKKFVARWALGYVAILFVSSYLISRFIASGGDVEAWRQALSFLVLVSLAFFVVAANSYLKYDGTEEEERRHLRAIRPQIINSRPAKLTVTRGETLDHYRSEISSLFDGERPEQPTITESLAEFQRAWEDQTRSLPGLAMKLVYEAVLIIVFGAIVVLPLSWWSSGEPLGISPDIPSITGGLWSVLSAIPAFEVLFSLGLLAVIVIGQALFENWFVIGLTLLLGAAVIALMDREIDEDLSVVLYPDRRGLVKSIGIYLLALYAVGAVPSVVFSAIGFSTAGVAIGLLGMVAVTVYFLKLALFDLRDRLFGRQHRPEDNPRKVAAYLLARKVWGALGFLCLPILLAYAVLAIGTGQILAVAWELTRAPIHVQASVVVIFGASVLVISRLYPELVENFRDASRRATSSQLVRGLIFARGIPIAAVFVGFAVVWPLFGPMPALIAGILVGSFARLMTLLWEVSKYRFVDFIERDGGKREVVVEGFSVEDADGDEIYIARVDGHELAHRDRETLVGVIISEVSERLDSGKIRPSFAHYFYEQAVSHGHVDIGFVADEYRADIKTRILASLRESDGRMQMETMDKEMREEYADGAYRQALGWLKRHGDVDLRRGEYVLH